jgi:hypothetical protein
MENVTTNKVSAKAPKVVRVTEADLKRAQRIYREPAKKAAVYGPSRKVNKRVARSDERMIELSYREGKSDKVYQIVIAPTGRVVRGNRNEIRRDEAERESLEAEAKLNEQVADAQSGEIVRGKDIRRGGSR